MPEISVIVPCYNVEKYLSECLESVLKQSFQDFEIICIEDCSTDDTRTILQKYEKTKKINVIYHSENTGLAISRNDGMKQAKGTYIFFLDSDDTISPNCLEILYNEMHKNPQCDICCGAVQAYPDNAKNEFCIRHVKHINEWIRFTPFKNKSVTSDNFSDFYLFFNCLACNKLYRKDFIEKNKLTFINAHCYHEDNGFWLKVLSCRPTITALEKITYHYRIKNNSISDKMAKDKKKHIKHLKKSLQDALEYIQTKNCPLYNSFIKDTIYNLDQHWLFSYRWTTYEKHLKLFSFPIFKYKFNPKKEKSTLKILGIPIAKWRKK